LTRVDLKLKIRPTLNNHS